MDTVVAEASRNGSTGNRKLLILLSFMLAERIISLFA